MSGWAETRFRATSFGQEGEATFRWQKRAQCVETQEVVFFCCGLSTKTQADDTSHDGSAVVLTVPLC